MNRQMVGRQITINSKKYDGSIRRSWQGGIVSQSADLIVVVGRFDANVEHNDLGLIRRGTVSFEHFWTSRWYNIFRFHEPDGSLRNYYCNVSMPPTQDGDVLDYVDLDIDVVVWPDRRVEVLDRDDFERNALRFNYPQDVIDSAEQSLVELLTLIEEGRLP